MPLKLLGIKVFLGHCGEPCKIGGEAIQDFVIVDINGIHLVDVQFCGCYETAGASHPCIQLLRSGLFPATYTHPLSAFSYDILDTFHLLTLQGKISAYDFYISITRKTDNTGTLNIKVCFVNDLLIARSFLCGSVDMSNSSLPFIFGGI